jgi:hypothetical protein
MLVALLCYVTQVANGLACSAHYAIAGDSWQSTAVAYKVVVTELIRSNPSITTAITPGIRVFISPCINGVLHGTQRGKNVSQPAPAQG